MSYTMNILMNCKNKKKTKKISYVTAFVRKSLYIFMYHGRIFQILIVDHNKNITNLDHVFSFTCLEE